MGALVACIIVYIVGIYSISGNTLYHTSMSFQNNLYEHRVPIYHARIVPLRLVISKIGIDAPIELTNILSDGTLGVPVSTTHVALFIHGSVLGQVGTAVIDGHAGWDGATEGSFDMLHTIRVGDSLYISDTSGEHMTFIVRALRIYNEHDDTSVVFISSDGKSHLNLITCAGDWDPIYKKYPNRLVVFSDRE